MPHRTAALFVGDKSIHLSQQLAQNGMFLDNEMVRFKNLDDAVHYLVNSKQNNEIKSIVCDASLSKEDLFALKQYLIYKSSIPLILYGNRKLVSHYAKGIAPLNPTEDFLYDDLSVVDSKDRINFLIELRHLLGTEKGNDNESRFLKPNLVKRTFDIMVSGFCILLLSPALLLISLAIKLESRGPVFFISERAGAGYRIFDFYKFRTMQTDADEMRDRLKTLNSYYAKHSDLTSKKSPFFFKVKNDPRVTRVGRFLRKTSLDELPQLLNVLKGDMSLVGNRPLPLDEGATLTIDHSADRFLAPAGMTGLWQIAKNKDHMTVSERINLDVEYARNSSFLFDMRILIRTIPAMLQRE